MSLLYFGPTRRGLEQMRRREFASLIGGATAVLSFAASAQQPPLRHIGVLMGRPENDSTYQSWVSHLLRGLSELGWTPGQNLHIEYRWTNADVHRIKQFAKDIVALKPDAILADGTAVASALKSETSSIPIVFVVVSDPIGAGLVQSLAHPGGNFTGFLNYEDAMGGKWIDLLKEVAPAVTHAAMIFNPDTATGAGRDFLSPFQTVARKLGVTPTAAPVHNPAEIERAIMGLASKPGGGLVAMADSFIGSHAEQVIALAEKYKLPAVYGLDARRAEEGALLCYSPDYVDMYRRSATYIDRILKGESPRNLPVQAPTLFELVINLKTARALGLSVPPSILARSDKVIE